MLKQGSESKWSRSPYVLMPILLLMWGSLAAVSKLLLNNLNSYQVLFYMYGLAAAVFLIIMLFRPGTHGLFRWSIRETGLLIACGVLSFLYDFFYLNALSLIPAVEASMLNYLFPIFIVLLAVPIHKEKLTLPKVLSVGMGFAGTVLLMTKGDWANIAFTNLKGDMLAIAAAVCWGLFTNLIKKNQKDMLQSTFFITAVAFVLSSGTLAAFSRFVVPNPTDFSGVFWLSMSNIVLGFFLYFRALQYSPASLVASFTFFTPFVTLLFIVVLVGEKLTATDGLAAVLILFSVPVQKLGGLFPVRKKRSYPLTRRI